MYKSYIQSCSMAIFFIHRATGIFHCTFLSLELRQHAAAIGLTCRLLDEGCGDLQSFIPKFVTTAT